VGIVRAGRYEPLGTMRERLDEDHAANWAVEQVVRDGLFRVERRSQVACRRVMDTFSDLVAFIEEFPTLRDDPEPHDWLIARVRRALDATRGKHELVVQAPLALTQLLKRDRAGWTVDGGTGGVTRP
jgi:hypothetical protein